MLDHAWVVTGALPALAAGLGLTAALALSAGALIGARRRRDLEVKIEALRAETRTLADAAERARSLLEAQGD